ncbi:MAG: NADH dehydrogenase (quinone) subunit D [Chloroflexi bacterium]|nr:NADH dehydrogenase (quinone) subunit D [Chloroflexota bacterium]
MDNTSDILDLPVAATIEEISAAEAPPMILNLGPQHPSTHGVLRVVLELSGETVLKATPVIGYLHTGFEKTYESRTYLQGVTLTDRMDYLAPLSNNFGYALAVEQLLGVELPLKAIVARILLVELTRLNSHLVWLGTQAMDLGASSIFLYCFREREMLLDIFELVSGQRMMTSYIRPGGLMDDLPAGFDAQVRQFLDIFLERLAEYETILTRNELFLDRMVGVGVLSPDTAGALGVTGPNLRASGVDWDLRRDMPYAGYDAYQFDVPLGHNGDCYDRYMVRIAEMRQSHRIARQALDALPTGPWLTSDRKVAPPPRAELATSMESLIHHFKLYTEGYRAPRGEAYTCIESPRGELGYYIVSDGSARPYRVHVRAPSFVNLQALNEVTKGHYVADLIAILGSLDPVLGEVDR